MNNWKVLTNGIIKENPILISVLGTCPMLATTTSAINAMSMGLATMFVLVLANMAISLIKNIVPDKIRIPVFVVVISSFVTIVDVLMLAYVPEIYKTLGIFIPLIVVNCVIFARAESFAARNGVFASMLDGIGMGLGYTLGLTTLGIIREILGCCSVFGYKFMEADGILVFVLAPGAFFGLAFLIALAKKINAKIK